MARTPFTAATILRRKKSRFGGRHAEFRRHALKSKNTKSMANGILSNGGKPEGHIVSRMNAKSQATTITHMFVHGWLLVEDTADGRIRLRVTKEGERHSEVIKLAKDLEGAKARAEPKEKKPFEPMPVEEAAESLKGSHALRDGIFELLVSTRAKKATALGVLAQKDFPVVIRPMSLLNSHSPALRSLEAHGLIRLLVDRKTDSRNFAFSLTEAGAESGIINALGNVAPALRGILSGGRRRGKRR